MTPPRITRIALLSFAALLIALLVARNAAIRMLEEDQPALALRIWPPSGRALAEIGLDRVVEANGNVDAQTRALMEKSLRRAPVLADPIILAGLEASAADDLVRARALMKEAERRDPRSVLARSWLLSDYLGDGDYAAGLDEAGPLMTLQPEAGPAIMAMVTALVQIPLARPALVAKLRSNPGWRTAFFRQASGNPTLVPPFASLMRQAPNADPAGAAKEQQALLQGIASQGRYALAYRMWLNLLPPPYRGKAVGIYDGDFQGWPGVAPFNWSLRNGASEAVGRVDVADLPERSALQISASGNRAATLAEQMLVIRPGSYVLTFNVRRLPDTDQGAASLGLQIRCATGGELALLAFDAPPAATARALSFSVRPNCPAVIVTFLVKPGEDPGGIDAQLTGVRLERHSGSLGR